MDDAFPMLVSRDGPNPSYWREKWANLSDRNRRLLIRAVAGATTTELMAEFGITRERVRQITLSYRIPRFRKVRVEWKRCLCGVSYQRTQRREHLDSPDHFWRQVDRTGDGCWEWQGARDDNRYGSFRKTSAHRQAYRLTHGSIPDGMWICHHCDNPPCVRPDHLYVGTPKDNTADMYQRGRDRFSRGFAVPRPSHTRTHCIHGHEYTPRNTILGSGGSRACRQCALDRSNAYRARKRAARAA